MSTRSEDDLAQRVRVGSFWTLFGTGGSQALSFVAGVVLARLLTPADFGMIAASLLFLDVGSTLVASSFVSTLVRRADVTPRVLDTGFVLQLLTAAGITVCLVAVAPLVADLMDNDLLTLVIPALSLSLLLLAFRGIPTVIARRAMDFRAITVSNFVEIVGFGGIAIAFALMEFGVWSLVFGRLLSRLMSVLYLCYATRWRPRFRASREDARELIGISVQFAAKEMLSDISKNVGYFFVGARLGVEPLGLYSRAHYLMTLPVTQLSGAVSTVLFPAFAKIQDDPIRLVRGITKSTCLITLLIYPMLVGLALVAPLLIPLIYGQQWTPSVVPLQILCVAGLCYATDPPAIALINAKGYLMADIKRQCIHLVLLILGVIWGSSWGLTGVAMAVTVASFVNWLLLLHLIKSRIAIALTTYMAALVPALLASLVMAAFIYAFQSQLADFSLNRDTISLLGSIAVGAVVYAAALWVLRLLWGNSMYEECFTELTGIVQKIAGRVGSVLR